jgi:hypothetical protein
MSSSTREKVTVMHWIDPACLPGTQGLVERFITNRHGEVDGVLLAGTKGTPLLICTPPHIAAEIEAHVQIGDTISIRGVRPRGADVFAAVALTAGSGAVIIDNGPGDEDGREAHRRSNQPIRMEAEGVVRLPLFGPKGELRGALLEDGTVVRIDAKGAATQVELLRPGAQIALCGTGLQTKHGRVIAAERIGPERCSLRPLKAEKRNDKPKHKKKHRDDTAAQPDALSQ